MSDAESSRVKVTIYGQEFALKGTLKPERIYALATYMDKVMVGLAAGNDRLSANNVAILAGLHITSELFDAKEKIEALEAELIKASPRAAKRAYQASKRNMEKDG